MSFWLPLTLSVPNAQEWVACYRALLRERLARGDVARSKPPVPLILAATAFESATSIEMQWIETIVWANGNGYALSMVQHMSLRQRREVAQHDCSKPPPPHPVYGEIFSSLRRKHPFRSSRTPGSGSVGGKEGASDVAGSGATAGGWAGGGHFVGGGGYGGGLMYRGGVGNSSQPEWFWYRHNWVKRRPTRAEMLETLQRLRDNWETIAGPVFWRNTWPWRFSGRKKRRLTIHVNPLHGTPQGGWEDTRWRKVHPDVTAFRNRLEQAMRPLEADVLTFDIRSCSPCRRPQR